ncbi:tyrosine-type recombinase/integrase [Microbulbifer mangrovi]|uniref:tyrosine-type recombinase/integrase n=1 Tax=Microbulbifer mangrovi TaxID=927787 RepID=UPI0009909B16|nr:integrase arm-type DNA-binding domain-containing protein [Microbulbifer mangrovi]
MLSDTKIKQAKAQEKPYKLADQGGLYLLVNPTGSKLWRFNYRYMEKGKTLAIGKYPALTLKRARQLHLEAQSQLAEGRDPAAVKKAEKLARKIAAANSFEHVALEWVTKEFSNKEGRGKQRAKTLLEKRLFPSLGSSPISAISAAQVLDALRPIERAGLLETAHRTKQLASRVFRYAVATARTERDPTVDLRGALKTPETQHRAAITDPREVGPLMLGIHNYQGTRVVQAALKLSPLFLCRPGELRHMEWSEIDWANAVWEIPAEKMKMRQPHMVPLCQQAIRILRQVEPYTAHRSGYVFPSNRGAKRPMSENAIRVALLSLGYEKEQMTPHGFRAMGRTILDEVLGFPVDWIEHQLAHQVRDVNGRAYNRTKHLHQRAEMMQRWADYLDELRAQTLRGNIITLQFPTQP